MTLFAGIDLGTSGSRCIVVDDAGRTQARAAMPWTYRTDDTGFPTIDTATMERAIADTLAALTDTGPVTAVGVTSQRHGLVFLDAGGEALAVMPNLDGRAVAQALAIEREHGDVLYRTTGRLLAILTLAGRYAWLRAHRPDVAARVQSVLSFADWLLWRMTGVAATDATLAAESSLFDVATGSYSEELIDALGVPRPILPVVRATGSVGPVRDGRFAGAEAVPAGADTQCASLALGCIDDDDVCVVAGSTMLVQRVVPEAAVDPAGRAWTSPHALPGHWVREVQCWESGTVMSWVARVLGVDEKRVAVLASSSPPGADGFVFVGPMPSVATDFPAVRAGGLLFPSPLAMFGRGPEQVARAVLEGIAFAAADGVRSLGLEEHARATVCGGVARASVFTQALAGATGRTFRVATEPDSSALGAAIRAAIAHHGGDTAIARAMCDPGREVAPEEHDRYAAAYAAWRARAEELDARAIRMKDLTP